MRDFLRYLKMIFVGFVLLEAIAVLFYTHASFEKKAACILAWFLVGLSLLLFRKGRDAGKSVLPAIGARTRVFVALLVFLSGVIAAKSRAPAISSNPGGILSLPETYFFVLGALTFCFGWITGKYFMIWALVLGGQVELGYISHFWIVPHLFVISSCVYLGHLATRSSLDSAKKRPLQRIGRWFAIPTVFFITMMISMAFQLNMAHLRVNQFCSQISKGDLITGLADKARSQQFSVRSFQNENRLARLIIADGWVVARTECAVEYENEHVVSTKTSIRD